VHADLFVVYSKKGCFRIATLYHPSAHGSFLSRDPVLGVNRYGYGHGLTLPHVELQFSRPLNWGKVTQSE
jgi:hypothetical protein